MTTTTALKEVLVDPVCGMTVDPARAAGVSERDGARYYFCSKGCKTKFDAAAPATEVSGQASCCAPAAATDTVPEQAGCCGGSVAAAPVQLTSSRQAADADGAHTHHTAVAAHTHHETATTASDGQGETRDAGVNAEAAQAESYRTMMRKFWFATAVGLPLMLLMFAEFVPAWRHVLMPYHGMIGIAADSVIRDQEAEIKQMKGWQAAWQK